MIAERAAAAGPGRRDDQESLALDAAALADAAGLPDLAAGLRACVGPTTSGLPVVVTCGEEKRGKSSLVNALAGRPLLSPVGDDVVTATYVVLVPGTPERAVVVMVDPETGAPRQVPVPLDRLADYVSVDAVHDGVLSAVVHLDTPTLRDFQLTDTPGVGGLRRGHRMITLSTLDTADALLFVMDAGAPLALPELRFLAEAARRVPAVVLVMTKTDLYPAWEQIRADDSALIAQHVPQLADAPILPVSNRLAAEAGRLAATNPEAARRVREASGLAAVLDGVQAAIAVSGSSPHGGTGTIASLLRELRARLAEQPGRSSQAAGRRPDVAAERDRLREFLADPHQGAFPMHRRIERIRRDGNRDFGPKVTILLAQYRATVESGTSSELRQLPALLQNEVAQLVADSIRALDQELTSVLDELQDRVGSVAVVEQARRRLDEEVDVGITEHRHSSEVLSDVVSVAESAIVGAGAVLGLFTMGATLAALAVAAVATTGLKALLAARTSSRQQALRTWLDRVGRDVEASFARAAEQRVGALERLVDVELPRLLQDRVEAIDTLGSLPERAADRPSPADVDALLARLDGVRVPVGERRP